jgi:hypothetical protein
MSKQRRAEPTQKLVAEDRRRVVAAALAGGALGAWPAFTLGVYGVIFVEQHLALWAAATSAFLALSYTRGPRAWRRPAALALFGPSPAAARERLPEMCEPRQEQEKSGRTS